MNHYSILHTKCICIKTLDLVVSEKIYHKFINHFVQPNIENTNFDCL